MNKVNEKFNLLLGFHSHMSLDSQKYETNGLFNELLVKKTNFILKLIDLIDNFENIKAVFHFSGNLISYLDKHNLEFPPKIRKLLDQNKLELLGGGMYDPLFPFIPKEDRQSQLLLMNRLLDHNYGYTPSGAWITESAWEPSLALELAKARIEYTCLPKEYFTQSGLNEEDIYGYYLTEEEGRKVAIFPISHELNNLIKEYSPEDALNNLTGKFESLLKNTEKPLKTLFYKIEDLNTNDLSWLSDFFCALNQKKELIEIKLFKEYFLNNKAKGRIYLPTILDLKSSSQNGELRNALLKYPEANLLHKKMLRVSKKINSAKEGKSRFKVIKEMINQAQDLLLKGQSNNAYWDNHLQGIYCPQERHTTYSNLIKAENLIDAAARQGSKWIQLYEIDYDCDGNDEIIIETETQNIYISPALGGTILEHDYRPKNFNTTNMISRKKENYHNGNLIYDNYTKLNLIDHFLQNNLSLEQCRLNKLSHITEKIICPYSVEKIKAKEESCKVTLHKNINLTKLENNPQIELVKQFSTRSGDSSFFIDYLIINKSQNKTDFTFAVEFNLSIVPFYNKDSYFYLGGNPENKTLNPDLQACEEVKEINQVSIYNKIHGLDLSLSWNKNSDLFRYPIETLSFNYGKLQRTFQGITLLLCFPLSLEPNVPCELLIKQDITTRSEEQ